MPADTNCAFRFAARSLTWLVSILLNVPTSSGFVSFATFFNSFNSAIVNVNPCIPEPAKDSNADRPASF